MSFSAASVCILYDLIVLSTLKQGGDDVTVHQGLDVVLGAHGQAAQHHGTLCPQLQRGGALLQQVQ